MEHMDALRISSEEQRSQIKAKQTLTLGEDLLTDLKRPSTPLGFLRGRARSPSVPHANSPSSPSHFASAIKRHFSIAPQPDRFQLDDEFFDSLSRAQGQRLDDQRCNLLDNKENHAAQNGTSTTGARTSGRSIKCREDLLDYIAGIQARRLDEQRAELPLLPLGSSHSKLSPASARSYSLPVSAHQVVIQDYPPTAKEYSHLLSGLTEQSVLAEFMAARSDNNTANNNASTPACPPGTRPPGRRSQDPLPDSFFDMLIKHQGARMEDQRASISVPLTSRPASNQPRNNPASHNQNQSPDKPK